MSAPVTRMPSFRSASAALRKTTERLAAELVAPSDTPPDWTETEWAVARAVAAMQGISALLATRLRWSGPSQWHDFLDHQREQTLLRQRKIADLLVRIDEHFRSAGLSCVGLKGASLGKLGLYRLGERPMGDIDLLADAADLDAVDTALACLGYKRVASKDRHIVYGLPNAKLRSFGEDPKNPIPIEVHTKVSERLPVTEEDISAEIRPALIDAGLNGYPERAVLLLHLLMHTAGNIRSNTLRFIQLYDLALFGKILDDREWGLVVNQPGRSDYRWWTYAPLALTERYFPGSIPAAVLEATRTACSPLLRRAASRYSLVDVSWSNLRIAAFPGMAFARTPAEALRLIRSRVFPAPRSPQEIQKSRDENPHLDRFTWFGSRHRARILRWLVSRPPRVLTMASLHEALKNEGRL